MKAFPVNVKSVTVLDSRQRDPGDIEPEFAVVSPDSDFALVTLQEQSAGGES